MVSVAGQFRERARNQFRDEALDAAARLVVARGWQGLQMREVARQVGVSRQTLYNEFTHKHGLAQALLLRLTERFLDGIEHALDSADEPRHAWSAAVRYTLETAADEPLLKVVLTTDGSDEFLPLLTTEGAPIVQAARDRIVAVLQRRWPNLNQADVTIAAEAAARLTLSHVMLPLHPADQVADDVSRLLIGFLRDPHRTP
jgi:AcrR family transcriptional regulator